MSDEQTAKLTAASREHFNLLALDPDAEQFMHDARNLAGLIRRNQPTNADPEQWELALVTASAAFGLVSRENSYPDDQKRGVRATLMMMGAVGWLLGGNG